MAQEFRVLRPREYHSQLVSKGVRADGRSLDEAREIKLEIDAIRTADSSSLVKLGNTSLVCGCTSKLVKSSSNPENGEIIKLNIELPPICSSPMGFKAQQTAHLLSSTLKNILEDSDCIDKSSFYDDELDMHWSVQVEVICLNYDGSVLDAALLAIVSALESLKLTNRSGNVNSRSVTINNTPICSSFAIIGDRTICDPNLEEETVASCTFSIAIDLKTGLCCHINKLGGKSLLSEELFKCMHLAKLRAEALKSQLSLRTKMVV